MAVYKVMIVCVFFGLLSRNVIGRPTKGRREERTSMIYRLPKELQLHDTFDIIIHNTTEQVKSSISLMTRNRQTACTVIIKSDDKQMRMRSSQDTDFIDFPNEEQSSHIEEISLHDVIENSFMTVSFTVRINVQKDEICLDIGGKSGYIKQIEIDPNVAIEDIKFVKIDGVGQKVSELKFKFNLDEMK